jgi:hypothetical protein
MAFGQRVPSVGGRLTTLATGREATQAPSDEFLTELGLRALREAYDTMSARSRTTPGTRPPPTTEQTRGLASMRAPGGPPGGSMYTHDRLGNLNSLSDSAAAGWRLEQGFRARSPNRIELEMASLGARRFGGEGLRAAARNVAEDTVGRRRQEFMRARVGQGQRNQRQRPRIPRPMEQVSGRSPTRGIQQFDPRAAYGGLMS